MSADCPHCVFEKTEANCRGCFEGSHYRPKPITNADRIRAMTDMELAKELSRIHGTCDWCPMHDDCDGENCDGQLLDWMKQEAE